MGVLGPVFRAHSSDAGGELAIKLLRLDVTPEQARSLADALGRVCSRLPDHDHIAAPRAAGLLGTSPWIACDYIPADSLDSRLRRRSALGLRHALPILRQVAAALDAAASAAIHHGCLHPRDVLVSTAGDVHVTGFGVADAIDDAGGPPVVRRPYTAPERVGPGRGPTDQAADVFALGAIAVELLTGRRLVGTGAAAVGLVSGVSEGVDADVCRRALARALADDPADRFSSAGSFVEALARAVDDETAHGGDERGHGPGHAGSPSRHRPVPGPPTGVPPVETAGPAAAAEPAPVPAPEPAVEVVAPVAEGAPPVAPLSAVPSEGELALPAAPGLDVPREERHAAPPAGEHAAERSASTPEHVPPAVRHGPDAPPRPARRPPRPIPAGDVAAPAPAPLIGGRAAPHDSSGEERAGSQAPETLTAATAPERAGPPVAAPTPRAPVDVPPATEERLPPPTPDDLPLARDEAAGLGLRGPARTSREEGLPPGPPSWREQQAPEARGIHPRAAPAASLLVGIGLGLLAGYLAWGRPAAPEAVPSVAPAAATKTTPARPASSVAAAPSAPVEAPARAEPQVPPPSPRPAGPPRPAASSRPQEARTAAPAITKARQDATARPAAAKRPSRVEFLSRPAGARVYVDGRLVGSTPLTLESVAPGTRAVRLQLDGYRPWATTVDLAPGQRARVAASLELTAVSRVPR